MLSIKKWIIVFDRMNLRDKWTDLDAAPSTELLSSTSAQPARRIPKSNLTQQDLPYFVIKAFGLKLISWADLSQRTSLFGLSELFGLPSSIQGLI